MQARFFSKRAVRTRSRRGFSLVISLVMMALMLLVAIALVSFVYVQSRLTEGKLKHFQAQINAIGGMRIALGQLQLLAGDDQRVTATADILGNGANKSLPEGNAVRGKRFWTGVWATGGLDKSKIRDWSVFKPDTKPFLGWLVSDFDAAKEVYSPNENPINKTTAAQNSRQLLRVAQADFDAATAGTEVVTLVGAGTLGTENDAESRTLKEREVRVRRVPIAKYSSAATEPIRKSSGAFAYWVGDEGVKARVNIPDGTDEDFDTTDAKWTRLTSNTVAQRNSAALVSGLSQFDKWWKNDKEGVKNAKQTKLGYVDGTGTLSLYAGKSAGTEVATEAKKLFHDVSFSSQGIFTDIYNGGLKTDLSVAFEMPWFSSGEWKKGFRDIKQFHGSGVTNDLNLTGKFSGGMPSDEKWWTEQPSDGLGFLYEIATGETTHSGISGVNYQCGPTWDVVRNYYRLYKREDEKKGFRGLRPQKNDSWLSVGSKPYTFLSGEDKQIAGSDGTQGHFGVKYNYALVSRRPTSLHWPDRSALLPEFGGIPHSHGGYDREFKPVIPQSMRIAPVVRRVVFRFSIIMNQDTAAICFDPIITIHNPYNVPIEFFGFGTTWTKFYPINFKLVREDEGEDGKTKNWPGKNSSVLSFNGGDLFGMNAWDWRLFSRVFAGTTDILQGTPSGTIRMLPGEVKVMFPASKSSNKQLNDIRRITNSVGSLCDFRFEDQSVMMKSLGIDLTKLSADETLQFHVEVDPISSSSAADSWASDIEMLPFFLHYPLSSNGRNASTPVGTTRSWGSGGGGRLKDVADTSDYDFTQIIGFTRYGQKNSTRIVSNSFSRSSDSGIVDAEKQYFAYIDVRNLAANGSPLAGPFATNARPWAVDPGSWDENMEKHKAGIGWDVLVLQDQGGPCPVESRDGSGFWGDDVGSAKGQSNIVLFEIPQAPLLSLGQLQHVECSVLEMEPSYVIGNSYPNIGFKDSELKEIFVWKENNNNSAEYYISNQPTQPRADTPFAANLQLFDRYFFSGVNFGTTNNAQAKDIDTFVSKVFTEIEENPFPNKRISLIRDFGDRKEDDVKKDFYDPEKIARDLIFSGTFNVNSTSVEAWKAVLSGLRGKALEIDGREKVVADSPVIRFVSTIGSKLGGFGNVGSGGDEGNGWRWFCELNSSEIERLAKKIVEEVRSRGPFMSMGDFVNRRLATDATGKAGALQAAIDSAKINDSRRGAFDDSGSSNPDSSSFPNLFSTDFKSNKKGVPGYVSQGDLLSALAPGLSARSDTFTIRAYGDVSGITGTPEARAWCEAVVQRVPEFFEEETDGENDEIVDVVKFLDNYRGSQPDLGQPEKNVLEKFERNSKLKAANKLFGRRYKIISFRWLSQDEI